MSNQQQLVPSSHWIDRDCSYRKISESGYYGGSSRQVLENPESLNYDIWDLILNDNGQPRLKRARAEFLPLTSDKIIILEEAFKFWCNYSEYLHLENRKTLENVYVKCSKRGNDVYNWRLENSLRFLKEFKDFELFSLDRFKNKVVIRLDRALIWRTLTFDSKLASLASAWEDTGDNFERWISRVKRHYGEKNVSYIAFIQPFPGNGPARGYPHYHVLLLIENNAFNVHRDMAEEEGTLKMVYRLDKAEEEELDSVGDWHSPVQDTKVLRNGDHAYNYCFKYIQNAITGSCWPESVDPGKPGAYEKSLITNSILWLYRKRAFNCSGGFREAYGALIRRLHNSKPKQVDFEGWSFNYELERLRKVLLGLKIPIRDVKLGDIPSDLIWIVKELIRLRNLPEKKSEWRVVGFVSGGELEELLGRPPGWVESVSGSPGGVEGSVRGGAGQIGLFGGVESGSD